MWAPLFLHIMLVIFFTLLYFRSILLKTAWRAFCLTRCTSSMPLVARQQAPSSRASPALPQWSNARQTWSEHRDLKTPALVVFIQRDRQHFYACVTPKAQDFLYVWFGRYFLKGEKPKCKQMRKKQTFLLGSLTRDCGILTWKQKSVIFITCSWGHIVLIKLISTR